MESVEVKNHKAGQNIERTFIGFIMLTFILTFMFGSLGEAKEFNFIAQYNGEWFESHVKSNENDKDKAFELAATQCFNHFKGSRKISETEGLDIIDVCANIRQK